MEKESVLRDIQDTEKELKQLPKGTLVYKTIYGRKQPYLQWSENGKTKSKYIKTSEREEIFRALERKKFLLGELNRMKASYDQAEEGPGFLTNVLAAERLKDSFERVRKYRKRDCYPLLERFLKAEMSGKVCLLYGLRRTGKTTLLLQAFDELNEKEKAKAVYIKARTSDTIADLNKDLKRLWELGCRYVFVDEVTLLEDFIDSASLFSDVFAAMGMKIVLAGTESLGFWFTLTQELYDRALTIHTTYIPFREYRRLLQIDEIDEYIRYGGTLQAGELDYEDPDALMFDAAFRDDESTRRYIDTAVCGNIQHSLKCCKGGNYFRHLQSLYEADELTGAINRIIEDMNHRFLLSVLTEPFKSHDLGSAAQQLRKQADPSRRTTILDQIDREQVTKKLMNILKIRNEEDRTVGILPVHAAEIKEYLKALDLIVDCPRRSISAEPEEYFLFAQPGMRYCQAQALVHVLMKDEAFSRFSQKEKDLACGKILEDVKGRMMEDIVLLDTTRILPKNRSAFKLTFSRSELDMVIYDEETNTCEIYEVKHSREIVPRQYHALEDKETCELVEKQYGRITRKIVIYRGEDQESGNQGIEYRNVGRYLNFNKEPVHKKKIRSSKEDILRDRPFVLAEKILEELIEEGYEGTRLLDQFRQRYAMTYSQTENLLRELSASVNSAGNSVSLQDHTGENVERKEK